RPASCGESPQAASRSAAARSRTEESMRGKLTLRKRARVSRTFAGEKVFGGRAQGRERTRPAAALHRATAESARAVRAQERVERLIGPPRRLGKQEARELRERFAARFGP